MSHFCTSCGATLSAGNAFCPSCGGRADSQQNSGVPATGSFGPNVRGADSFTKLLSNPIFVLAITGFIGGAVGAVLSDVIQGGDTSRFFTDNYSLSTGVWFSLAMLGIGAAMSISQGIAERNVEKSTHAALLAIPTSLVGGFFAGMLAQKVYESLLRSNPDIANEVPRTIGWAIAGALGGLAVGAGFRSLIRLRNCFVGGLVGGAIGGLLFNSVGEIVGPGFPSRLVGLTLIGSLMGLAVALIDRVSTSICIEQMTAEGAPIRFPIFDQTTVLGCANNVGITIRRDPLIAENHVRFTKSGSSLNFEVLGSATPIGLNGQPQQRGQLQVGDVFSIGNSSFRLTSSKMSGGFSGQGAPAQAPWVNQNSPAAPPQTRPTIDLGNVSQPAPRKDQTLPSKARPTIDVRKPPQ